MSMLRECSALGCRVRTLGAFCVFHETPAASSGYGRSLRSRDPRFVLALRPAGEARAVALSAADRRHPIRSS